MGSFIVEGGHKLSGAIRPQGAKNEALQVISAVLLTKEEVVISNIPEILDVKNLILLLEGMGVEVKRLDKGVYSFKAENINEECGFRGTLCASAWFGNGGGSSSRTIRTCIFSKTRRRQDRSPQSGYSYRRNDEAWSRAGI